MFTRPFLSLALFSDRFVRSITLSSGKSDTWTGSRPTLVDTVEFDLNESFRVPAGRTKRRLDVCGASSWFNDV